MAQMLVADELIEAACQATGLSRFDSESFREGLGILLTDFNGNDCPDAGVQRLRFACILGAATTTKASSASLLLAKPE